MRYVAALICSRLSEKFLKPTKMMKGILFVSCDYMQVLNFPTKGRFSYRAGGMGFATYQEQPVVVYIYTYM